MVRINRLRFEHYQENTLGIGESRPRISWSFEGDDRDWFQEAYEIGIKREGNRTDTVRISSSGSLLEPWPFPDLLSGERVELRVRAADRSGNLTEWSNSAIVEAGLLIKDDWRCSLIEPSTAVGEGPHRPVVFRREVNIIQDVDRARLYITAHGIYVTTINGVRIGNQVFAPGWTSYSHRQAYQTFDVTPLLKTGTNVLEIIVAEGWYCGKLGWHGGRYNIYGDRVGVIAMLTYKLEDASENRVGTDGDWQWTYGPFTTAGLYDGVTYNATQAITGDTLWKAVNSKPLNNHLITFDGPSIRRQQELRAVKILEAPSGKTILDMGQNMVGWVKVKIKGTKGHKITFRFAEVLENGELCTRPLRTAKATDTLILDGNGFVEWEPEFTFHGFRYVEVSDWPGELTRDDVIGVVIHTDMKQTGSFACSNRLLNKLHENVAWSMKGNFVGLPTDCPQRDERLGWTGDINMFADTSNFLFDTCGLLTSWLADLKLEQAEAKGIVPLVIPSIYEAYTKDAQAIWGDVAVVLPWRLYLTFGDKMILERQYDSIKAWLDAFPRRGNGLWNYTAEWKLADWLDPAAPAGDPGLASTDPTHVSDTFLVHITGIMAEVSAIVGTAKDMEHYAQQAQSLGSAYANEYVTPSGLLADNTQTALSLALAFDLLPSQKQIQRAAQHLQQIIRRNSRFKIATGFAGTPYIGHALTKIGLSNVFYRMLLACACPSWLYPVTMGATTIWER